MKLLLLIVNWQRNYLYESIIKNSNNPHKFQHLGMQLIVIFTIVKKKKKLNYLQLKNLLKCLINVLIKAL